MDPTYKELPSSPAIHSTAVAKPRLEFLDTLRGVAILAVFLYHALGVSYGADKLPWRGNFRSFDVSWSFLLVLPATFGSAGVALFFAISGFCIHLSWVKHPDWRTFIARRFWRIYPPYLFTLILCSILARPNSTQFFSHFFLVHNLGNETFFGINGAFWSVAVEVQLYAIYPLLIALSAKVGWGRSVAILAVLEFSLRILLFSAAHWVSSSPLDYWFSWTVGAWVAERYYREERLPLAHCPVALLFIVAAASEFYKPTSGLSFPLFALATAAWISQALGGSRLLESDRWFFRQLRIAGLYSYSIYLIHVPIITSVREFIPRDKSLVISHAPIRFCITLALWIPILWLSLLMYRLVEKPSMDTGKVPNLTKKAWAFVTKPKPDNAWWDRHGGVR